jgi:branched-subunit amino acid transport protein AzlD
MKTTVTGALIMICAMGAVVFFSRAIPFLFFSGNKISQSKGTKLFLEFIERIAPPAAMTVLAFNALGPSLINFVKGLASGEFAGSLAVIIAAALTAAIHIWKRNSLISIFGGTAIYMILQRVVV